MSGIPLHIQRKVEQRWAAKLALLSASAAPKNIDPKKHRQQLAARHTTAKEKPANDNQLAWAFIPFPEGWYGA